MMTDHATQSNWTINLKTMDVDDDDDDAWEESDDDDDTDDRNDDDTYDDRDDDFHGGWCNRETVKLAKLTLRPGRSSLLNLPPKGKA